MGSPLRFRIAALSLEPFVSLFQLDDTELHQHGARRLIADSHPGFPCRVSLQDASVGEQVILAPYAHHDVDSPYRASGPIFVRQSAQQAFPDVNEVPECVRSRLLSLRAYDRGGMMIDGEVTEGTELEAHIERFFANPDVAYLHLHNARAGCYSCRVNRA